MVDGSPSDESMLALKSNSWYEDDQLRYQRRTETIDGRGVTGRARAQRRLFLHYNLKENITTILTVPDFLCTGKSCYIYRLFHGSY